jgi:hypothetical protein
LGRLQESGSLNIDQRLKIIPITTSLAKALLHITPTGASRFRLKIQFNPSSQLVFNHDKH